MLVDRKEPIAVIGSACRFPGGSSSPSKLWELLREPRDVLQKIPNDRFNTNGVYNKDGMYHGSTNVTESYLLSEDYRHFDAQFFKIQPVEAHSMDPQQRLLLETVYESLESAGECITRLRGSNTAVYVGLMTEEYSDILSRDMDYIPTYFPTAVSRSIVSNRISYVFDWHGPSMTIDTACSSSLVAVHQAVQSLRNGDMTMAVAAGANLCIGSKMYIAENKLNMLSPGSRSRMWDADADGYARGDGVAALILKPLSKALQDGDHIECLIRESGVNQDGRTQGITMPSEIAQEKLIRETYSKAGLDIRKQSDRPQFFEAHGTGTPAGDPVEAAAIHNAFFRHDESSEAGINEDLHVGSIKTVIGHTEGTAGIAALMKASLAMQHSVIPPNLLFNNLSTRVAPFYGGLKIPTSAIPWPSVPAGQPKRASVNSFGFGGTNAHVILESYDPSFRYQDQANTDGVIALPFTFSAASEKSLASNIRSFAQYLAANRDIDLMKLAHTLNFRRSPFPFRRSFSATTLDTLLSKLNAAITSSEAIATVTSKPAQSKILGIFTGQGAQWPTMGRELIQTYTFARTMVERLQHSLDNLPKDDVPSWCLLEQLSADPTESLLNKAAISQPLCTVVQVILVDLLRLLGINFHAVVGHSSGEMAAAYAAGFLTAEDAVKIAYYRGLHSAAASGPSGERGAMLAVGTTLEDALELCEIDHLRGRISVAACNSSSSVTLSGDIDAIEEAQAALDDEGKFVRKLKVDTAYHSHHMLACADGYIRSLEECNIRIPVEAGEKCSWYSSVTMRRMDPHDSSLRSAYWSENMIGRVNFTQAINTALEDGSSFGAAFEVGPHPALQGPAIQTIQEACGRSIPYSGTLARGKNDIEAFADAIGFALAHIPEDILELRRFALAVNPEMFTPPLKGLPSYSWEHDRVYWMESRIGRAYRTRNRPVHELLGTISHDGSTRELRWRNMLSPKELPWMHGHKLQGQIVFPGSGYVCMAIEAAMISAGSRSVRLIEIHDLVMDKAMVFEDEQATADVQFTLIIERSDDHGIEARFHIEGTTNQSSDDLATFSTGLITLEYGETDSRLLPLRSPLVDTVPIDTDAFYQFLQPIGYEYSEDFKALMEMNRTMDAGTALIRQPRNVAGKITLLAHPSVLDCAVQAIFLALCLPGDNGLWSLHVPTGVGRIRLNPALLATNSGLRNTLPVDASLTRLDSSGILGDVDVYAADGQHAIVQMEGVKLIPFGSGNSQTGVNLFFDIRWDVASPDGNLMSKGMRATIRDQELATLCERVAYFYLRTLTEDVTPDEWSYAEWHFGKLKNFADHCIKEIECGRLSHTDKAWALDTREYIYAEMEKWPGNIDLKLLRAVGENLPASVRSQTTILEHMMHDKILNDFYVKGVGFDTYTDFLSNAVMQLNHRYANMDILEIGAGTGAATKSIMRRLGRKINSYTYTDISSGFFEKAQEVFHEHGDYMSFRTLDVEKDPVAQGFEEHSFDLIVCSLVLHATENLQRTLSNVRRLLKPGGYLAMLEITNTNAIRIGFAFGGLPGWWLGHQDGRELNPCVVADRWDAELRQSGFAGIDAITPAVDTHAWPFSIIVAQSTDDRVELLNRPLLSLNPVAESRSMQLTILGGATPATSKLANTLRLLLQPWYESISCIDAVEQFDPNKVPPSSTVLSLTDLDKPVFDGLAEPQLDGMRNLFEHSRNVLWITQGARSTNPYAAMIIGFVRTLTREMPHLRIQFLNHEENQHIGPERIAETLLRLQITDAWEPQKEGFGMLWTLEPELTVEHDRIMIPRVYASTHRNDRYNSTRRSIYKPIELPAAVIGLIPTENGYSSLEVDRKNFAENLDSTELTMVRLTHSTSLAIRISNGSQLFLAKGLMPQTGKWVIAVLPELASEVMIPKMWTILSAPPVANEEKHLALLSLKLFAQYVVGRVSSGGTLLVHEPSVALAQLIANRAAARSLSCVFTTSHSPSRIRQAIHIHPCSTFRTIKSTLPGNVDAFVNMSPQGAKPGQLLDQIYAKPNASWNQGDIFSKKAFHQWENSGDSMSGLLQAALLYHDDEAADSIEVETISVQHISEQVSSATPWLGSIIDWVAPDILVKVEPVESRVSFRSDRTYLLFGLSGQLGRSLVLYMVRLGAKHIVLTSRRPAVDENWLVKTRRLGADVRVLANDITDRESVLALVKNIRETMPPIAGVANGAMVLEDTAVMNMTSETMNRVLSPKVNGSRYLDELFQRDHTLDFFVLFSSVATIYGQHGQSNYTAANMFLNGLVAQRRRNGLSGSVIAIGAIMGIGYFSRDADELTRERVIDAGYRMMSERDFHSLFAEGILCGPSDNTQSYEIITGLREMKKDDAHARNPLFHHVIVRSEGADIGKDKSKAKIPLRTFISSATTEGEVYDILKEAFMHKFQIVLQRDEPIEIDMGAEELGIDSFVAVEIRSWFLKELMVNISVLKILSGASINAMIAMAMEGLPTELIPNLQRGATGGLTDPSGDDQSSENQTDTMPISKQTSRSSFSPSWGSDVSESMTREATIAKSDTNISVCDFDTVESVHC